jgi:hypothetical protein
MEEAVEICKLRLFLKLVAQVDNVKHLEPLPDIDFNIRAGNTLVGFVSLEEIRRAAEQEGAQLRLISGQTEKAIRRIEEEAEIVERAFQKFHEMQTEHGMDARAFAVQKQELRQRLKRLAEELDQYLAREYGVNPGKPKDFEKWRKTHQPFHWFAEFYGIMQSGGFNVVLGNPPWREYATVRRIYRVQGYATESCGNLHGICTERALSLRSTPGRMSFIVQLPLTCSPRMTSVRSVLTSRSNNLCVVPFDDRPGKLFDGLQHCRSVIFVSEAPVNSSTYLLTTRYQRWPTEARPALFSQFEYAKVSEVVLFPGLFPKYATDTEVSAFAKVRNRSDRTIGQITTNRETKAFIFYQEATQYWVKATIGLPYYAKDGLTGAPAHGRYVFFEKPVTTAIAGAILNSSLFYAYFIAYGDCFHLSDTLVTGFPIPSVILTDGRLETLGRELQKSLNQNANRKTIRTRDGSEIGYAEFYVFKSKAIIDDIDRILAEHYRFTDDELDFIINYDIKYRMGIEAGEDEE